MRTPVVLPRALASAAVVLAAAYFAWWGCFAVGVPLPEACGGVCCPTCQCCGGRTLERDPSPRPYCTAPGEACPEECTPGTFVECACSSGFLGTCECSAEGFILPCRECEPGVPTACLCPKNLDAGIPGPDAGIGGTCTCNADGTLGGCI